MLIVYCGKVVDEVRDVWCRLMPDHDGPCDGRVLSDRAGHERSRDASPPSGDHPSRERGGEFAGRPTASLAAQCRMQARKNVDPEYSRFMFAVADRLQGFAASKSQGAPSTDWQLAYAIEWANRSVDSVKERMWAVEDGLRALVDYLAHTPHHNAPEAAAARKLLRSEDGPRPDISG